MFRFLAFEFSRVIIDGSRDTRLEPSATETYIFRHPKSIPTQRWVSSAVISNILMVTHILILLLIYQISENHSLFQKTVHLCWCNEILQRLSIVSGVWNIFIDENHALVYGLCNSIDDYQILNEIGKGTYGYVYRGRRKSDGLIVALKKIKLYNEGQVINYR